MFDISDIGSLIGAGSSLFSAVNDASNKSQANSNAQTNVDAVSALRQQMLQAALAKSTDARGTVQGYDPTRGWYTDLSPTAQALQTGQDSATLQRMATDAPIRQQSGDAAQGYLAQLAGPQPYSRAGITGDIANSSLIGLNQGYKNVTDAATTQALRSGTSAAPILQALASRQGQDYSKALSDANVQGANTYENLATSNANRVGGLYSKTANVADTIGTGPGISDTGIASGAATQQAGAKQGVNNAGGAGGQIGNQATAGADATLSAPNLNIDQAGAAGGSIFDTLMNRKKRTADATGGEMQPGSNFNSSGP